MAARCERAKRVSLAPLRERVSFASADDGTILPRLRGRWRAQRAGGGAKLETFCFHQTIVDARAPPTAFGGPPSPLRDRFAGRDASESPLIRRSLTRGAPSPARGEGELFAGGNYG